MGIDSARAAFELRVIDPDSAEHTKAITLTLLANVVELGGLGPLSTVVPKVELRIVDKRSGTVVYSQTLAFDAAHTVASEIGSDLDTLSADAFANRWAEADA